MYEDIICHTLHPFNNPGFCPAQLQRKSIQRYAKLFNGY